MKRRKTAVSSGQLGALLATLCLLPAGAGRAHGGEQNPWRPNIVHAELLGSTLVGLNYERLLSRHASFRLGVGVPPINEGKAVLGLVMPTLLLGSDRHQFEAGVGALFVSDSTEESYTAPAAAFGYRHRASGGTFFRACVAVEVFDGRVWVMPGVGVGLSF